MKPHSLLVTALAAAAMGGCAAAPAAAPADDPGLVGDTAAAAPAASVPVSEPPPEAAPMPDAAPPARAPAGAVPPPVLRDEQVAAIDRAIRAAIAARVTPGAVVAIGGRGGLSYLRAYGAVDYAPGASAVADSTIYDLASLTKVVGTTTAVMLLVERGVIALEDPLHRHLSVWPRGGWRDGVTIRRLLTHTSGLSPFVRFWHPREGGLRGADAVVNAIVALGPAGEPGERFSYSDLGFILLGAMVAEVTGIGLDVFLAREAWEPLGMTDTGFNPHPAVPLERIAPTEVDTVFRHTHVHGVVHDENAYAMGGVAGHAGLFSTAPDLARFAEQLLRSLDGGGSRPAGQATAARFTTRQPDVARALGWDAAPGSGGIARALSPRAFGHTGFTGTSLWLDPDLDLYVVLLTNRVNPTRDGTGIAELRRTIHSLARPLLEP